MDKIFDDCLVFLLQMSHLVFSDFLSLSLGPHLAVVSWNIVFCFLLLLSVFLAASTPGRELGISGRPCY
jgi:hypothetical protein